MGLKLGLLVKEKAGTLSINNTQNAVLSVKQNYQATTQEDSVREL
uniref:Uncharacterized protein n=1 Tax=Arundo donax TaxID=35708 RepID=A0A0A8ZBC0_ARUDO